MRNVIVAVTQRMLSSYFLAKKHVKTECLQDSLTTLDPPGLTLQMLQMLFLRVQMCTTVEASPLSPITSNLSCGITRYNRSTAARLPCM